jgi:hypothetical protein
MISRAHGSPHRRQLHLLLEPLEDRTVLSGSSGVFSAYPRTPTQTIASPANASQSLADSTATGASGMVGGYTSPTAVGQIAPNSASTPVDNDADYSATPAANSSGSQSASHTEASPGLAGTSSSRSAAYSNAGTSSGTVASSNLSSGQTTRNAASYNSGALSQEGADPKNEYYARDYYASEYQAVEREKIAARQVERITEAAAFQVMLQAGQAEETAPAESGPPSQPPTEIAVASSAPNVGLAPTTANVRSGNAELIPAMHHPGVPADWTAELVAAESDANGDRTEAISTPEVSALADQPIHPPIADPGILCVGALPLDWEALERGIDRFFARLGETGRDLLSWPGVVNLGAWLAAGATATALFELARRKAQTRLTGAVGRGAWRTSRDDSELLLFYGPSEL